MSCSCTCSLPPSYPLYEYSKKTLSIPTTYGSTYCEVYYPNHFTYDQLISLTNHSIEILLIVHGLGGSCRHFAESDIPAVIAQNHGIVVCFDLYTHGKSELLKNKTIPHNLDLFLSQVYDVIHCPELFLHKHSRLHMLGFSFGGWITLNYLIKHHKVPNQQCCTVNHSITKVVFQSPWDGYVPSMIKGLLHVPGLLRLIRPTDMAYINDYQALKHILFHADKEKKFKKCIEELLELLDAYDTLKTEAPSVSTPTEEIAPSSPSTILANAIDAQHGAPTVVVKQGGGGEDLKEGNHNLESSHHSIITDSLVTIENNCFENLIKHHSVTEILFLSGKSEPLFTAVNNTIRKSIFKHYKKKMNGGKKPNRKQEKMMNLETVERRFPQRICRKADHMTFVHQTNHRVGQFYRDNICDFLFARFHVEIPDDAVLNPSLPKSNN